MKAVVRKAYGTVDELEIRETKIPEPKQDQILIKINAFGLNHAELYMRQGLSGEVAAVSGIECVGTAALTFLGASCSAHLDFAFGHSSATNR